MGQALTLLVRPLALLALLLGATGAMAEEPERKITKIAGDLYSFQNGFYNSVFLVTEDGIIVTDPNGVEAATWLKAELAKRFDQPIRYLIYSHDHGDHSGGGEVFADTAVVVAHEKARATIIGEKRPTAVPELTFNDRMTIELGGKKVHLLYLGRSHSDNMIVVHFPEERTLFTVDFVSVKRLPYQRMLDAYFPDWIAAVEAIDDIDFDIMATGHGPRGTKQDAADYGVYLKDLYNAVLAGVRSGLSLEELKIGVKLEKYKDWGRYDDWREMNIEGMYRQISLHRRGN